MKKPTIVGGVSAGEDAGHWVMPEALAGHPFIGEFLANPRWEDNDLKGQRALMCFIDLGSCVTILKVQTPALKMTAVGKSLTESWTGLELCMVADVPPWMADDNPLGKRRRK